MFIRDQETKDIYKKVSPTTLQELYDECNYAFIFANGELIEIIEEV